MALIELIKAKVKNPLLQRMIVYAFSDGISKAMPFLVFPIVAYYLTKEEFGLVANFIVLMAVINPFIGMSTNSALTVDYYSKTEGELPSFYANLLYTNLILYTIALCFVLIANKYIENWTGYSLYWQLLVMVTLFFSPFKSLFITRLRLEEKAKSFGKFQIFTSLVSAILTYLFVAVFLWTWKGRIYSLVFAGVLPGIVSVIYTFKFLRGNLPKLDLGLIKATLIFGLPLLPHNLSFWLKSGFNKLLVTGTQGLAENGVMAFAQTISAIFVLVISAFFGAYTPYLFKQLSAITESNEAVRISLVKKSYLFLIVYLFILIVGYLILTVFVEMFFVKYVASLEYLIYFLGFNFFNACYAIFSGYIFYTKSTKFLGLITISTSFIQVILSIVLVNLFGGIGAAYSTLIVSIITAIVVAVYSNKRYPMPWLYFIKK
jgi:O-antigen/teichoic acid export membrane protein